MLLQCVVNVSEGRDDITLAALAATCGEVLLELHRDPDHHRSVFTLGGPAGTVEATSRQLTRTAVNLLDVRGHRGAHPRFGVVDVVPFVALGDPPRRARGGLSADDLAPAVAARDRFAHWAADALGIPCFLYGPLADGTTRQLPDVRRGAFSALPPDVGPRVPHPSAGATAVGARGPMVAYNLWVADGDVALARAVAGAVRGPAVRALGLDLAGSPQVSCNLVDPLAVGPADVYDRVAVLLARREARVARAELVGLVPDAVLQQVPARRWRELDLSADRTVEARLASGSVRR